MSTANAHVANENHAKSFAIVERHGALHIRLPEQLILGNAAGWRQWMLDAVRESGLYQVVIDFAGCQYIDSSGLGTIVSIRRNVDMHGGRVTLRNLNSDLTTLFELTKLDELFTIEVTP